MTAILLMAVLALLAGVWFTQPWWRATLASASQRRQANIGAYRQRLAELEADRAAGLIDAVSAETLRTELGARLLGDASQDAPLAVGQRRGLAALLIAALIGLLAAGGYAQRGSWRAQALIDTAASDPAQAEALSLQAMVDGLATRLAQAPDDLQGWAMLGRSYAVLERYNDAAQAYVRANALSLSQDPELLVAEGEALAMARERDLLGRPQALFDQALAIAPAHPRALWYAGLAAAQAQDWPRAQTHWAALARQPELPETLRTALQARLAELSGQAGPAPATAPALTAAPPAAAPQAATSSLRLRIGLQIKPEFAAGVPAGASLLVFARPADESGGPPLAVWRGPASPLPDEVTLDDTLSMLPTRKLSQFNRWQITARISRSGQAMGQAGDVEGSLVIEGPQAGEPQLLVLDRIR